MKRFRAAFLIGGIAALALHAAGPSLSAQTGVVAVEQENFRAEPGGNVLARLAEGTSLALGEARGRWRQATLEGWIWASSVQPQARPELDLIVNAGGENLRSSPNGPRIGTAQGGMRLESVEARDNWIRVRRTGWIWEPSLTIDDAAPAGEPAASASPAAPTPAPRRQTGGREFAIVAGGAAVLDNPAGDTVAQIRPGASLEVVSRDGDWSRVRIEGWAFTGALAGVDTAAGGVLRDISRDSLQASPERFRGRLIEWNVQFIALQEAERFRTDFLEGEPFILARGPGEDPGFVYLAVPPERLEAVSSLAPLQRIRVFGRIRTARSTLTDAPVIDLLEITGR